MNTNTNKEIPMGQTTTTNPALALRIAELSAPSSNEFHEHPEAVGYRRGLLAAYRIVVEWDGTDADLLTECRTLAVSLGWNGLHPDAGDTAVTLVAYRTLRAEGEVWRYDIDPDSQGRGRIAGLYESDVIDMLRDGGFGATAAAALVASARRSGSTVFVR